ncbi:MAG: hypothetical protein OXM61_16670 [Candidatus Poribacteria bacterium]|nr:hypothetical protein [Candidatus Poribacteria bacterium]
MKDMKQGVKASEGEILLKNTSEALSEIRRLLTGDVRKVKVFRNRNKKLAK